MNISEANTSAQETNESTDWKGGGGQNSANVRTPASGTFPMQNLGKVKFDPPKVPVIFVLGELLIYKLQYKTYIVLSTLNIMLSVVASYELNLCIYL